MQTAEQRGDHQSRRLYKHALLMQVFRETS